jgi:amino acid transporter
MASRFDDGDDARALSRLGYTQELLRAMGGFSSFALSFSIISILTGILTTYGTALSAGGPFGLGFGWPLVSVGTLFVACAMAELASAFPTAGALYHWAALLGGPGWGWFTAMMNLVGQTAIVAAIDLGCARALAATLGLSDASHVPLFAAVLASHVLLNIVSVRLVAYLNDLSASVHIVGVVVIAAALLVYGRSQPASFLFETGFTTRDDGRYAFGFLNALILGMYTFTGYDASAHVSEETHDPARRAPWGIVSAVLVSAVFGYVLLAAVTLAIRDLPAAVASADTAHAVVRGALGDAGGNAAMALANAAMWFCGLSSVTSFSRTVYAFARDGGLPMSTALRRVSPAFRTPHLAIVASGLASLLLVLSTWLVNPDVFEVVVALATTGLYVSYALPVALGLCARLRGVYRHRGPWHLGPFGVPVAIVALVWSLFVLAVGALPPNHVAGAALVLAMASLAGVYAIFVRGRFRGPAIDLRTFERSLDRPAP